MSGLEGAVNLDSSAIDEAARKSAILGKNLSGLEGAVNLDSTAIDDAIRKSATLEKQIAGMSKTRTLQVDDAAIDESIKKSADLEKQLSGMSGASIQVDDAALDNAIRKSANLKKQISGISGNRISIEIDDAAFENLKAKKTNKKFKIKSKIASPDVDIKAFHQFKKDLREVRLWTKEINQLFKAQPSVVNDVALDGILKKIKDLDERLASISSASVQVNDMALDDASSKAAALEKQLQNIPSTRLKVEVDDSALSSSMRKSATIDSKINAGSAAAKQLSADRKLFKQKPFKTEKLDDSLKKLRRSVDKNSKILSKNTESTLSSAKSGFVEGFFIHLGEASGQIFAKRLSESFKANEQNNSKASDRVFAKQFPKNFKASEQSGRGNQDERIPFDLLQLSNAAMQLPNVAANQLRKIVPGLKPVKAPSSNLPQSVFQETETQNVSSDIDRLISVIQESTDRIATVIEESLKENVTFT